MKPILFVLSLALLAACAAPGHLNTPSGRPEITVHATQDAAEKASVQWLLANGFTVGNTSNTIAEKRFIAGNQYSDNGSSNTWIRFNYFSPDSLTTTIYASKLIWSRYGNVNRPQTSQADYDELQNALQSIAQNLK